MTYHKSAKSELKEIAAHCRLLMKKDKPGQRQAINDAADRLIREYWRHYPEKRAAQYADFLDNYAAQLHP